MEGLLIWLLLIAAGYFFGKYNESRHYRSIKQREQDLLSLPATASKRPLNEGDVARTTLVTGSVVVSVDYFKRLLAGLRQFFGGTVQSYETLLDRARREAVLRLKESCKDADEIVNLRLETASIASNAQGGIGSVEVLAYGTAIYYAGKP